MTDLGQAMEHDLYKNMVNRFTGTERTKLEFHISDLVNVCPRAVWYARKTKHNFRFNRTIPRPMALAFSYGKLIQELMSKYSSHLISKWKCTDCGKLYYLTYPDRANIKCSISDLKLQEYDLLLSRGWFKLTGSVDSFIKVKKDVYIAEIKSISAREFDKLEEPHFDHVMQTCAYLWLYNHKHTIVDPAFTRFQVNKEEAFIIYFKKDFQKLQIKAYKVEHDMYDLHKRIPALLKEMVSSTIPPQTCLTKLTPNAKKCKFREVCFNESKKKQAKSKRASKKDS